MLNFIFMHYTLNTAGTFVIQCILYNINLPLLKSLWTSGEITEKLELLLHESSCSVVTSRSVSRPVKKFYVHIHILQCTYIPHTHTVCVYTCAHTVASAKIMYLHKV